MYMSMEILQDMLQDIGCKIIRWNKVIGRRYGWVGGGGKKGDEKMGKGWGVRGVLGARVCMVLINFKCSHRVDFSGSRYIMIPNCAAISS